ncbi:MAG: hypothetical protein JMN24_17570 [gamma proteobacterium endosymbiont of Lamellibrachia anaximandri]|nr:hypothetical protein [gamma proteobacterium endosymbiont of Lamellibrachia anaximandri]MBL3619357.1 hypothetical protein [gamma proteobacterium endosymbiont of Lamellibrachia anaximandri]
MGISTTVTGLKFAHKTQKPITIHGTPGRLQGSLSVINKSESKLTLRSMPIKASKLRGKDQDKLSELRLTARVYPQQTGVLRFNIPVDPTTPAGIYDASLQVGGESQSLRIQIHEHMALSAIPTTLSFVTTGECSFTRDISLENRGNTTIMLGGRDEALLKDVQKRESLLSNELQRLEPDQLKGKSTGDVAAALLQSVYHQKADVIALVMEDATLQPGEQQTIKGTFTLPETLQPFKHYSADMDILSARIKVDVYTRGL